MIVRFSMTVLYFLLMVFYPIGMSAQESDNLIPNGDFEKFGTGISQDKPVNWFIDKAVFPECETRIVHSGSKALRTYLNGASFWANGSDPIPVISGNKYQLSFWYYGKSNRNVVVTLAWYKGSKYIQRDVFDNILDKVRAYEEWNEKKREIQVPKGIDGVVISVKLLQESGDSYIIFDDFTLKSLGTGIVAEIPQPKNLQAVVHQREVELNWENVAVEGMTWEIEMGGKTLAKVVRPTLGKPSFVVDNLQPNTSYTFHVYAVDASGQKSKPAVLSEKTRMLAPREDEDRIPFLRTIKEDGYYNHRLSGIHTYFTDLYEEGAVISYWWDGVPVVPDGKWLAFDHSGNKSDYVLKVSVKEADGRTWDLEYFLTFFNN